VIFCLVIPGTIHEKAGDAILTPPKGAVTSNALVLLLDSNDNQLDFYEYRVYANNSQIYEPVFAWENGTWVNVSVYYEEVYRASTFALINNTNNSIEVEIPHVSPIFGAVAMLNYKHHRGKLIMDVEITGMLVINASDAGGLYSCEFGQVSSFDGPGGDALVLDTISGEVDVWDVQLDDGSGSIPFQVEYDMAEGSDGYDVTYFSYTCPSRTRIALNNTNDNSFWYNVSEDITSNWVVDTVSYYIGNELYWYRHRDGASGMLLTDQKGSQWDWWQTGGATITLLYSLEPVVDLNTSHYAYDDLVCEVWTFVSVNDDPEEELAISEWRWIEQDLSMLTINHPMYKLRLYDRETRELVFEDTAMHYFTPYRVVTINDHKYVNNAPEPANFSIIENYHYNGNSFDLDKINTEPAGWSTFEATNTTVSVVDKAGHAKALQLTDYSSTSYCYSILSFSQAANHTVELWFRKETVASATRTLIVLYEDSTVCPFIELSHDDITYFGGGGWHNVYNVLHAATWHHLKFILNDSANTYDIYLDGTLVEAGAPYWNNSTVGVNKLRVGSHSSDTGYSIWYDAIGIVGENYNVGDNLEINDSIVYDAFDYDQGHYRGAYSFIEDEIGTFPAGWTNVNPSAGTVDVVAEYFGHYNVLQLVDESPTNHLDVQLTGLDAMITGTIEFYWLNTNISGTSQYLVMPVRGGGAVKFYLKIVEDKIQFYNGTWNDILTISSNVWYHTRVDFDCNTDTYDVYVDGVRYVNNTPFGSAATSIDRVELWTATGPTNPEFYFDAFDYSSAAGYYTDRNLISDLGHDIFWNESYLVNPYNSRLTDINNSQHYFCRIRDLYNNTLEDVGIAPIDNVTTYTPAELRDCLVALSDQRNTYLDFYNYRVYLNDTQLYYQTFQREINTIWNVSVYDRFGYYLDSVITTINRTDNYVNIQLTRHSLKVFNQQEQFAHCNITRDPDTGEYWSEWLAPMEVSEYLLFGGNYKVNITEYETATSTVYDYTLNADDALVITSTNTISNAIYNIQNVNATLGNQITSVEINITNQNSEINNSIVNVDINLSNVNSTLGTQLLDIEADISNVNTTMSVQFSYVLSNLTNINSSINSQFSNVLSAITNLDTNITTQVSYIVSNITNINSSITNQISALNISLYNVNASISNQVLAVSVDLANVNSSINSQLIDISAQVSNINSTMLTQFTLINASVYEVGNWVNSSFTSLNASVYLINNSIYNAINVLSVDLTLLNNTMNSSITTLLVNSEYLTEIYQRATFPQFLNWSKQYNITDELLYLPFINQFKNDSMEILLRYQGEIERLRVTAQNQIEKYVPKVGTEYRVWSVEKQEYLSEWEDIDSTTENITMGFWEAEVPVEIESVDQSGWWLFGIFAFFIIFVSAGLYLKARASPPEISFREVRQQASKKNRKRGRKDPWDM